MTSLGILLLSAHLLAMNLASGGPLAALFLRSATPSVDRAGRQLAWKSAAALLAGCLLGGAVLLPRGSGATQALGRFPAQAYWFAGAEILFSLACILALPALWNVQRGRRWPTMLLFLLALASTTNLLYHFPPLMSVFGHLVADPAWTSLEVIERRDLLPLMARPAIVALSVHFALASLTVGCLAATATLRRSDAVETEQSEWRRNVRRLLYVAIGLTIAQFGVGLWLVAASESSTRDALLGGDWLPTLLFAGGILAALKLAERLVVAALDERPELACRVAERWLGATVLLMTGALLLSR